MRSAAILLLTLFLASCSVGPDYKAPEPDVGHWYQKAVDQAAPDLEWWKSFKDPVLDRLIAEAIAGNNNIEIAAARVREEKALHKQARAAFFPEVRLSYDQERTIDSRDEERRARGETSYEAGIDVSWELSLVGKAGRVDESFAAEVEAVEEAHRGVILSVISEVALNYFELRGLQKRLELQKKNVGLLREAEKIAKSRFRNGAGFETEVLEAKTVREEAEAKLPELEANVMATIYRLSVLTAHKPEHYVDEFSKPVPLAMPKDSVPVGLRSDLLRRRPDVREAERALAASSADIGAAMADLFPSLELTGSTASRGVSFSKLFTSGSFAHAAGGLIDWAIFSGWHYQARVEEARAKNEAAFAEYEKAVAVALLEAETALVSYAKEWESYRRLRSALTRREKASRIARLRFKAGETDLQASINAERAMIASSEAVTQSEMRIYSKLVELYKVLGGGWESFVSKKKGSS